jgi:hypothetical protein
VTDDVRQVAQDDSAADNMTKRQGWRTCDDAKGSGKDNDDDDKDQSLVGKSARNSAEFRDYSHSGPFELWNFHRNFIFLIVKCVPANLEHIPAGSESSPAIDSFNFMNRKMFLPSFFEMAATGVE